MRHKEAAMGKKLKIAAIVLGVLVLLGGGAFGVYVSDYYQADDTAMALAADSGQVRAEGNLYILEPAKDPTVGLVFYPGGKVAAEAYLPLMDSLRDRGVLCVVVKMPFHLAVFGKNRAEEAFAAFPGIQAWYIGGHSLGGAMASSYLSDNPDSAAGLILLGAYVYGDVDKAMALTIYGSEDLVLDRTKIDYAENVQVIEGGNHAGFGNYGPQKGDGQAGISADLQQQETVDAILAFMGQD